MTQPNPAPIEADKELERILDAHRIEQKADFNGNLYDRETIETALLAWRDKAVVAEVLRLSDHLDSLLVPANVHTDNKLSVLRTYIDERLTQLNGTKDE